MLNKSTFYGVGDSHFTCSGLLSQGAGTLEGCHENSG